MTLKQLSTPLQLAQLSAVDDGGEWKISGYATVFGNENCYRFQIASGAYEHVLQSNVSPKMFFNHNSYELPIGRWTKLEEDAIGLRVEGVLTQGVNLASDVYHAIKAGTIDGLSVSIGWRADDENELSDGRIEVKKISELSEISIVTYPADNKARITQTLNADEVDDRIEHIETIRDIESFLHDVANLSKRQSRWLTSKAKAAIALDKGRDDSSEANQELTAIFNKIHSELKTL